MTSLELDNHYFLDEEDQDTNDAESSSVHLSRPPITSLASNASIISGPTTAISKGSLIGRRHSSLRAQPEQVYIDHEQDRSQKLEQRLRNQENDLTNSLSSILIGDAAGRDTPLKQADPVAFRSIDYDDNNKDEQVPEELTPEEQSNLPDDGQMQYFLARKKHFLVLSSAGKPIYSRHGTEQVIGGYMGIIQAIMGFYQDSEIPDTLQSFTAAGLFTVFLVKGPVYLVSISKLQETESSLRNQLEFLYEVIVSSVTSTTMSRLFDRGSNFDLRRLLQDNEKFMDRICDELTYGSLHLGVLIGALSVFRLRSTLRTRINNTIASKRSKASSLLYGLLAVDKKLVSVIRPKGHSLYPADLRLLFETIYSRGFEEGQDFWIPLCLPKFNSTGYLHVFLSFLAPGIAVILMSADKDAFFDLQQMKIDLARKLEKGQLTRELIKAKHTQITTQLLSIDTIVEHFVFKNRDRVQFLSPEIFQPNPEARDATETRSVSTKCLMAIYATMQSSGPSRNKFQIYRFPGTSQMGKEPQTKAELLGLSWVTQSFELMVVSRPSNIGSDERIQVNQLIGAANVIHQFVRREEGRIWVDEGITF